MAKKRKTKKHFKYSGITIFLKVIAFLMPLPLYLLFTVIIFPGPNSSFHFMGIIGAFFLGLGLISVAGLLDGMYLGHVATGISIGIGGSMILISSLIMYIPSIYALIDEEYMTFYFLVWSSLIISAIWYVLFRMGVSRMLRSEGISKTAIDKLSKGIRNYWWYEGIHKEYNVSGVYHLNKWFTVVYTIATFAQLLLGWWKPASPFIAACTCIICVLNVPMWAYVGFSLGKNRSNENINAFMGFGSILGLLFPVAMCIAIIMYFFKIW